MVPLRRGALCVATLALASLAGCEALSGLNPEDDSNNNNNANATSGEFAGTWTRMEDGEPGLVFDVTDDGTTARGSLQGESETFSAYTFELKRSGDVLEGKAMFAIIDPDGGDDHEYEAAWTNVSVNGDEISTTQEALTLGDDWSVTERGEQSWTYAFEAAAPAGGGETANPEVPVYTPPAIDYSAYVVVLPTYEYMLYEGIQVGDSITAQNENAGGTTTTTTAVVAETDTNWVLEIDNQAGQQDLILAVFVDKETGLPQKAYVGNRGEEGKEKEVPAPPEEGETTVVQGEEPEQVSVTVPAGTFDAYYVNVDGSETWSGVSGDVEGVVLKQIVPAASWDYELQSLEFTTREVGEVTFEVKELTWTDRMQVFALEPTPPFNMILLVNEMPGNKTTVTSVGTGAEPELTYPIE